MIFSEETANALANAHGTLLNNGYLQIYDGTPIANADAAITTQVLLAELRFGSPAYASASGGVAVANAITQDSSADHTGTPTWYRTMKSDHSSPVSIGSVGTTGADLNLPLDPGNPVITAGQVVAVTQCVFTQPKS